MPTCTNPLNVTLGSNTVVVNTNHVDLVLLSAGQCGYLAAGAAGVAGPLLALCVLGHSHVGEGALRRPPRHQDIVGLAGGVDREVGGRAGSCRKRRRRMVGRVIHTHRQVLLANFLYFTYPW